MATYNLTISDPASPGTAIGFLDGTPMMEILEKIKTGDIAGAKEIMSAMESAKLDITKTIATCAGGLAADIELTAESLGRSFQQLTDMVLRLGGGQSALVERFAGEILEAVRAVDEGNKAYAAALAKGLEDQINNAVDSINSHADMIAGGMTAHIERQAQGINDHGDENTQKVLDAVSGKTGVSRFAVVIITIIAIAFGVLSFAVTKNGLTKRANDYKDKYRTGAVSVTQTDKPSFVEFTVEFDEDGKVGRTVPCVDNGDITMFAACAAGVSIAAVVLAAMAVLGIVRKKEGNPNE
jgi:hypothetical protein